MSLKVAGTILQQGADNVAAAAEDTILKQVQRAASRNGGNDTVHIYRNSSGQPARSIWVRIKDAFKSFFEGIKGFFRELVGSRTDDAAKTAASNADAPAPSAARAAADDATDDAANAGRTAADDAGARVQSQADEAIKSASPASARARQEAIDTTAEYVQKKQALRQKELDYTIDKKLMPFFDNLIGPVILQAEDPAVRRGIVKTLTEFRELNPGQDAAIRELIGHLAGKFAPTQTAVGRAAFTNKLLSAIDKELVNQAEEIAKGLEGAADVFLGQATKGVASTLAKTGAGKDIGEREIGDIIEAAFDPETIKRGGRQLEQAQRAYDDLLVRLKKKDGDIKAMIEGRKKFLQDVADNKKLPDITDDFYDMAVESIQGREYGNYVNNVEQFDSLKSSGNLYRTAKVENANQLLEEVLKVEVKGGPSKLTTGAEKDTYNARRELLSKVFLGTTQDPATGKTIAKATDQEFNDFLSGLTKDARKKAQEYYDELYSGAEGVHQAVENAALKEIAESIPATDVHKVPNKPDIPIVVSGRYTADDLKRLLELHKEDLVDGSEKHHEYLGYLSDLFKIPADQLDATKPFAAHRQAAQASIDGLETTIKNRQAYYKGTTP